jgi:hypothetical protein
MKSFILGFSTLLALAGGPSVATAQTQYGDPGTATGAAFEAGPEWNQDGAYDAQAQAQAYAYGAQPASSFGYFGPHPIPYDQGGGFCQHTGAHEHAFPVFDRNLFRMVDGYAYFVGDPMDFGYQSQAYVYRAEHPIEAAYGGGYCYMHWMHRHWFAPTAADFIWDGAAYMYNGILAAAYYAQRPYYANYLSTYYRPYYLGGSYYLRRPTPVYAGWGWHRPVFGRPYGAPYYRPPVVGRPWGHPGPVYAPPVYRAPAPVYRAPAYQPAPAYRAPVYQAPAYRAPSYHMPAPAYRAPAYQAPAYRAPSYHMPSPVYRAPAVHAAAPAWHGGGHFGGGHFRR